MNFDKSFDRYSQHRNVKSECNFVKQKFVQFSFQIQSIILKVTVVFQQKIACTAKVGCFTDMQNFVMIAQFYPLQAQDLISNPRIGVNVLL